MARRFETQSRRPVSAPRSGPGHTTTGQAEVIRRLDRSRDRRCCPAGHAGEASLDLGLDPNIRGRYLRPEYQPHPAKGSFNALGSELPSSAEKRDVTRLRGGVGR
jgi:hypothetical protein